jgi:hypothetical protein
MASNLGRYHSKGKSSSTNALDRWKMLQEQTYAFWWVSGGHNQSRTWKPEEVDMCVVPFCGPTIENH